MDLNKLEMDIFSILETLGKEYSPFELFVIRQQFAISFYFLRMYDENHLKDKLSQQINEGSTQGNNKDV